MAVTSYSTTAANNNSAPPNGFPEGQTAASLNDSCRQVMADIAVEAQKGQVKVLNTVAGTNTITASMTPALTAYSAGMTVNFNPANANTGAVTININGLGALDVFRYGGEALQAGDIAAGIPAYLILDSGADDFYLLNPQNVGFRNLPINIQNTNYTAVLADAGKAIICTATGGFTWTIPSNASVAYPTGTVLTFINFVAGGAANTIAITTDSLFLAGTAATGSRTLATNVSIVTAVKVSATQWLISGTGLS